MKAQELMIEVARMEGFSDGIRQGSLLLAKRIAELLEKEDKKETEIKEILKEI